MTFNLLPCNCSWQIYADYLEEQGNLTLSTAYRYGFYSIESDDEDLDILGNGIGESWGDGDGHGDGCGHGDGGGSSSYGSGKGNGIGEGTGHGTSCVDGVATAMVMAMGLFK